MGIATALVVIGDLHPNDTGISPLLIVELWEGIRATWLVRSIGDDSFTHRVDPKKPDDIFDGLIEAIKVASPVAGGIVKPGMPSGISLAVTIFENSSLLRDLKRFEEFIDCDVTVFQTTYSRTFNQWAPPTAPQWNSTKNTILRSC